MNEVKVGDKVYFKGHLSLYINDLDFLEGTITSVIPNYNCHIKVEGADCEFVRRPGEVFKTLEELKKSYIEDIKVAIKVKQIDIKNYKRVLNKLKKEIKSAK